jgi:diguanylate cyclase (GGDEF)-like protein
LAKQQELETLAERDTLTGLYNRRKFMQLAEQELARAARVPGELSLLMVDLDHFKHINDQYGHPAGDAALQQAAAILQQGVRGTDLVARMGGEEFIVLMPNTGRTGAMAAAEKLRHALSERPLDLLGQSVAVTASIGVTGLPAHQRASIDVLYAAADAALYAAKKNGRNRVECAEPAAMEALAEFSALRA